MNPMANTGILLRKKDKAFLGSCFVFRYPTTLLTANHCVEGYSADDLELALPYSNTQKSFIIAEVVKHPEADIAVINAPQISENDITWPQTKIFNDYALGQEFFTCGYPQSFSQEVPQPTPRVFKGHIQRFFNHKSHLGYSYLGAELSIGCPGGLSGAGVFNHKYHGRLFGLITENIKTTTELESVREVEENGTVFKENYHNIINYGVALWLPSISDWIDATIPPVPPEETNRRAKNQQRLREEQSKKV